MIRKLTLQRTLFVACYSVLLLLSIAGLLHTFWNAPNYLRMIVFIGGGMAIFYSITHIFEQTKRW